MHLERHQTTMTAASLPPSKFTQIRSNPFHPTERETEREGEGERETEK